MLDISVWGSRNTQNAAPANTNSLDSGAEGDRQARHVPARHNAAVHTVASAAAGSDPRCTSVVHAMPRTRLRAMSRGSGVVDIEGFLHLLSPINGAYVGRIATDGSAATSQPGVFAGSALWQTAAGNLFSVSAK